MEKELYNKMKAELEEERPWPYFPEEGDPKEFFEELKKEYPNASLHMKTGMGVAICVDDDARIDLATMIIGAEQCLLFYSHMAYIETGEIEIEYDRLINILDQEEDDTCFKVGG